MIEEVSEQLKSEIVKLFKSGKKIQEISDVLRIPNINVGKVLREKQEEIINVVKDDKLAKIETDGKIKTIDTIADLHEMTLKILYGAIENQEWGVALQAQKEAREQVELIMKNKGELDSKNLKDDLIPKDFGEFFINQLKKQKIIIPEGKNATENNT
jgi:hypothetical protein